MVDRIIIRNTDSEAKIEDLEATDVLGGEMLLVREVDKERLYCKNSSGEISKIHRITNAGGFARIEPNVIEVQKLDTIAGDVCAWDGNEKRFFRFVDEGGTDSIAKYTPIGVVVVPASHTDDSTARVASLINMNIANPDNGSTDIYSRVAWGGYGYSIPELFDRTMIPCISETGYNGISPTQEIAGWCSTEDRSTNIIAFSTDYYKTNNPNPFDEGTYFHEGYNKLAVSPYLTGGLKNELYYSTENSSSVCADMDGKGNTEKILAVDNGSSTDWQTAVSITNTGDAETIHPAAQCCWRYHTVGTSQGDWYLPSGGELGYIAARLKLINDSITKIINLGFEAIIFESNNIFASSTESTNSHIIFFYHDNDNINLNSVGFHKASDFTVRAYIGI